MLPGTKDQSVSAAPHSGILSPHSILGLRPPPSRSVSLLSPSSPPLRSIRSFRTTTDAPGSYLSSLQQGCDITSTTASSAQPLRPRGHPESPPLAGAQCLPPSNVLHDLATVSLIPSLLNSLVYQLGMPAAFADHMFTAIRVVDQDSTIGASSY